MALLPIILLALIQGLTEFLPVSSSGHLVLVWEGLAYFEIPLPAQSPEEQLVLDIAVHFGTLMAVVLYFLRDLGGMLAGLGRLSVGRKTPGGRLALQVIVGSIPLLVIGFIFREEIPTYLRDIRIVAWTSIIFGLVLFVTDRFGATVRSVEHLGWWGAVFVGCAQVLALIPGTSRSGITMSAARVLGFERHEAARFSLLLSIPAILAASAWAGLQLYQTGNMVLSQEAGFAAGISFLVALLAIAVMMAWLKRASFLPFVLYRLTLGSALLWLIYGAGVLGA